MVVPSLSFKPQLLEVLDRGDLTSIIDWMPHGRAFIIKQPKVFTAQVLSRFFKQTKFVSFTRQLSLWGFKRITRGIDAGAYYHALFLPGMPNLAMRMKRQKIKGTGLRLIPYPDQEPNFYNQYPHVARVTQSGVPIPLPPLPSEKIADLTHGNVNALGQSVVPQQHGLVGTQSLVPQQATALQSSLGNGLGSRSAMNRDRGLSVASPRLSGLQGQATTDPWVASSNKLDAISVALAAEFRLQGLIEPSGGLHPPTSSYSYPALLGFQDANAVGQSLVPQQVTALQSSLGNGLGSTSAMNRGLSLASLRLAGLQGEAITHPSVTSPIGSIYPRRASIEFPVAPQSFRSVATSHTGSLYPRRATIEIPVAPQSFSSMNEITSANRRLMERLLDQTSHAAPKSISPCRPSYGGLHEASLLGLASSAPSPAIRMESFKLHQSSHHATHITAEAAADISSLFGSYLPSPQYRSSLSSRMTTQDINMVTNALREAQHLEELARSQAAMSRSLAGALQQRVGYDIQDLLSLGGEFNDRGEGR